MAKTSRALTWQRTHVILTGTVVGVVVIACLYWAQVVFIPLALAVFLAFLMSPLLRRLEHLGLGRMASLAVVVTLSIAVVGGVSWMVSVQLGSLYNALPGYAANAYHKTDKLRQVGLGMIADRADPVIRDLTRVPRDPAAPPSEAKTATGGDPPRVVVQPESPSWLSRLPEAISPALGPFGAVGLALVLAMFMLLKREDLRNRFIRLFGRGQMVATTKAVEDASTRISRYLVMQLFINGTFGLAWGLGLYLIGVNNAPLWGFLAAALRYIPYIGAPLCALVPLTLSLVQFDGWNQFLMAGGWLLILELVSSNFMEPWLYGQSIGVSEVALLIAAAFWAFLWGPIGLLLSGPLTVCLVVLGRSVPALEFFDVLLGDEPVLEPEMAYYQRLLAHDQDEAAQVVNTAVSSSSLDKVYDELLLPALAHAKRGRERDETDEEDDQFILQATREILVDLGERQREAPVDKPAGPPIRVLGCAARDELDELTVEMLRQLLDPARWEMEVIGVETLVGELVTLAEEKQPAVLCIGSLPPGGLSHTRYLCKRLRARFPDVKIVVGRWGLTSSLEDNREQLQKAGADQVEASLAAVRDQLTAWLPVLTEQQKEQPAGHNGRVLETAGSER